MADEKNIETVTKHVDDVEVVEKVHVDGTVDLVDAKAIGGDLDEMPKGYFYSLKFIMTVVVSHSSDLNMRKADI